MIGLKKIALVGCAGLGLFAAQTAHAQYVHPYLLTQSKDGTSLQQAINGVGGVSASVGTYNSGTDAVTYGDQVMQRLFVHSGGPNVQTQVEFAIASYAPNHRLGYYRPGDPNNITWILGGSNTGLGNSASLNLSGVFGLVLDAGNNGANSGQGSNGKGNNYFYSQSELNSDTAISGSPMPSLNGFDRRSHVAVMRNTAVANGTELIMGWEDLKSEPYDGYLNYNDLGIRVKNVQAVPEPATMFGLAVGALALLRKRRKASR